MRNRRDFAAHFPQRLVRKQPKDMYVQTYTSDMGRGGLQSTHRNSPCMYMNIHRIKLHLSDRVMVCAHFRFHIRVDGDCGWNITVYPTGSYKENMYRRRLANMYLHTHIYLFKCITLVPM